MVWWGVGWSGVGRGEVLCGGVGRGWGGGEVEWGWGGEGVWNGVGYRGEAF